MKHRGRVLFLSGMGLALLGGWIGFPRALYQSRPQPVEFSHQVHTQAGGMKCEDCHTLRADGSFAGIPALSKCAECHSVAMGNTAAEKKFIDQYVTPGREVPWAVYARQPENVYFSHAPHLKIAKLPCQRCHGEYGGAAAARLYQEDRISGYSRDVWSGMKMDDCDACHHAHGAQSSCLDCHK